MNNEWFNHKFIETCVSNEIEPVLTGDGVLVLVCPRMPPQETQQAIMTLVPADQKTSFVESLRTVTVATIKVLLGLFGARHMYFKVLPDHRVVIEVEGDPLNRAFYKGNEHMWGKIAYILKQDKFVQSYQFRFNGSVSWDSDHNDCPEEDLDEDPIIPKSDEKPQALIKVTDNRFEYDRDFLPNDIGTDVKILLESSSSVEDFLSKI